MRWSAGRLLSPARPATRPPAPTEALGSCWCGSTVCLPPRGLGSPQAKQASPGNLSLNSFLLICKYNVCSSLKN